MSYFKAKMQQIRFRLGLRPRPRCGSLQRSPDPLAGFKGPTSKGRGGEGTGGGERRVGQGRAGDGAGRERGRGRERKENGDRPPITFGLNVALPLHWGVADPLERHPTQHVLPYYQISILPNLVILGQTVGVQKSGGR